MATKKIKRKVIHKAVAAVAQTAPSRVQTIVNGQVMGTIEPTGTIADALNKLARDHGLKSFSARANGVALTPEAAAGSLAGTVNIEVFAKDTRG